MDVSDLPETPPLPVIPPSPRGRWPVITFYCLLISGMIRNLSEIPHLRESIGEEAFAEISHTIPPIMIGMMGSVIMAGLTLVGMWQRRAYARRTGPAVWIIVFCYSLLVYHNNPVEKNGIVMTWAVLWIPLTVWHFNTPRAIAYYSEK